jgi:hypothetical protein
MDSEIGAMQVLKTYWTTLLVPAFWYLWRRIDNTYARREVEDLIDRRMKQVDRVIDRNTAAIDDLRIVLSDLRVLVAENGKK